MAGFVALLTFLKGLVSSLMERVDTRRLAKRRTLHIFVLKAIAATPGALAPDVAGRQFDLASIDRRLQMAQRHELLGGNVGDEKVDGEIFMLSLPEGKQLGELAKNQSRVGLPGIRDTDRQRRLEQILDNMAQAGRLRFHPPDRWSIT